MKKLGRGSRLGGFARRLVIVSYLIIAFISSQVCIETGEEEKATQKGPCPDLFVLGI